MCLLSTSHLWGYKWYHILFLNIQHQGHLASLQVNWRILQFLSGMYTWSLPSSCWYSSLSDPNIGQHWSFWSRITASSLYAGLAYLGCWINDTFFHHSLIAWRKKRMDKEFNGFQSNMSLYKDEEARRQMF